jgi:alpha-amylase
VSSNYAAKATGYTGYNNVSFNNIPISFLYDAKATQDYGREFFFGKMYFRYCPDITSITIVYNEGTVTPTTPTTPTTPPTVEESASADFNINMTKVTLNVGSSAYLKPDTTVTYTTTNKNIAKVFTSGRIQGMAAGKATVYAKGPSGDRIGVVVTVQKKSSIPATAFKLKSTKGTGYVGSSYSIGKTISPSNSNDKIVWNSSNPSVATVSDTGIIRAVGTGTTTITATTASGISSTCYMTVKNPTVTLKSNSGTVSVGRTLAISATASPAGTITYSSINESIATVSKAGVITGVNRGTTKIEVENSKGGLKVFTVTVT